MPRKACSRETSPPVVASVEPTVIVRVIGVEGHAGVVASCANAGVATASKDKVALKSAIFEYFMTTLYHLL